MKGTNFCDLYCQKGHLKAGNCSTNGQCKTCMRDYQKQTGQGVKWNKENKDKIKEIRTKHYQKNKEYISNYIQSWLKENPGKRSEYRHKRRALIKNSEGNWSSVEWINLCRKYDNICLSCHEIKPLTVDHVIPLIKGGSNNIDNIQPLCKNCNSKKGVEIIDFRPLDKEKF